MNNKRSNSLLLSVLSVACSSTPLKNHKINVLASHLSSFIAQTTFKMRIISRQKIFIVLRTFLCIYIIQHNKALHNKLNIVETNCRIGCQNQISYKVPILEEPASIYKLSIRITLIVITKGDHFCQKRKRYLSYLALSPKESELMPLEILLTSEMVATSHLSTEMDHFKLNE